MSKQNSNLQNAWGLSPTQRWFFSSLATVVFSALIFSGNIGCGKGGLATFGSATELPEFDSTGEYSPYYATGEMNIPRYLHEALSLGNGVILVMGGSDENGLSSIDSMEIYDQSTIQTDQNPPPSETGSWVDTNFEGDPIALQVGRIYFTATQLPNDKILILGGSPNLGLAREIDIAELYDPLTREIEILEEKMVTPRFRHTATALPGGKIMILGGQIYQQFTISEEINVNGGGNFGSGQVQLQQQIDTFPSIKTNEFFQVSDSTFLPLEILDTGRPAELTTRRGRSGHTTVRFAGPDDRLNTGDDLFLVVGGFMTLSGENAPNSKFFWQVGNGRATALTSLEFYDPIVEVFTKVPILSLARPRVNTPQAITIGDINEVTPDGVLGLGNAIFIANGDNDSPNWQTNDEDELLTVTYTGFGPSQGLQMFRQLSPNGGHIQGIEYTFANGGVPEWFPCADPNPGRTGTEIVVAARRIEDGYLGTSVYNLAGVGLAICPPGVPTQFYGGSIAAGVLFDPFFSLEAVLDFETSSRDLRIARIDPRNPTGVVGTWLLLDGDIPTTDASLFGTTPVPGELPSIDIPHVWTQVLTVAGPDGVDNTPDDRPVIIGGAGGANMGDPSIPSTELLIQPGQGVQQ